MKSKLKFESFDQNNKKVPNPQLAQQKNLAKAGIKKIVNKDGLVTNFHLILNYFKDEAGKTLGHLLDVGENKKLSKHFEQVEMKSGKLDKSMSASQKEAATGTIYVKTVNDKAIVHVEPHESCKIPGGKWAKILKELKPQFAGMKAVVVLEGMILSDESETEETPKEETVGVKQRGGQLNKMQKGVQQMNGAVGKTARKKLYANIQKYEVALKQLVKQAQADGVIDDQEQAEIDALTQAITDLKENVNQNGSKLTEGKRNKLQTNIGTMSETVKNILKDLGV